MISTILIIGGGQAGAQAIDTLRKEGFGGRLVLIGDEPQLPYQRPPLSKKYLSGEMAADRLPFRHRSIDRAEPLDPVDDFRHAHQDEVGSVRRQDDQRGRSLWPRRFLWRRRRSAGFLPGFRYPRF